jgi:MerR family transcriptional regulator, heat shock protein HspR
MTDELKKRDPDGESQRAENLSHGAPSDDASGRARHSCMPGGNGQFAGVGRNAPARVARGRCSRCATPTRATARSAGNAVDPMASLPIDDQDAAVYSVCEVAGMLQVTQASSAAWMAVVCPARLAGGQRRYSRRQIARVARVYELVGEGLTLAGARRVLALQYWVSLLEVGLDAARAEAAMLRTELAAAREQGRAIPVPTMERNGDDR